MKPTSVEKPEGGNDAASLIERAAQVYNFDSALAGDAAAAAPAGSGAADADPNNQSPAVIAAKARRGRGGAGRRGTRGRIARVDRAELAEMGFILPDTLPTALAEEFRIVKRQLLIAAAGIPNGRSILICSSEPDEGKTYCSVNLALSLANEKDIEVVLVDADFSKPEILSTLGIERGPGLMDAIADPSIDVESCIIRTDIGCLSVLPAGRSLNEATELLSADQARTVIDRLTAPANRIVLFDSAPALAASSSSVLSSLVGQVLVVVRADVTGEAELREALSLLSGCSEIRLLLNAAQLVPQGRRFGAYYGYGG